MNVSFSIITTILLIGNLLMSQENEKFKSDSLSAESSKTSLYLVGYSQKKEWADSHNLIIDYTSIVSVNAFRDEKNPKVSITTKELMIDGGVNENRIYWISFKSVGDIDNFMGFLWKYKSVQPAVVVPDPKF